MATAYQIAGGNYRPRHAIAHKYGANLYVRLWHRNNDELSAWKSTDDGATWAQAGGVVYCGNGQTFIPGCGTSSGSIIYCTYHHASSTPDSLRVARYDMAADDWTTTWTGPDVPFSQWNQCGVRSDGSLVIIYLHTEPIGLDFQRKWKYVTCTSGGTFGTPADLSTAWQTWPTVAQDGNLGPVIIAADDSAHFFYHRSVSGSSSGDLELMHRRLSSGGALGAETTVIALDGTRGRARGGVAMTMASVDSVLYAMTDGNGISNKPAMMHGAATAAPATYAIHPTIATDQQGVTKVGTTGYGTWPVSQVSGQYTGVQIGVFSAGAWGATTTVNDGASGEPTWVWWMVSALGTDALGFVLDNYSTEHPWFLRHPVGIGPAARYYAM